MVQWIQRSKPSSIAHAKGRGAGADAPVGAAAAAAAGACTPSVSHQSACMGSRSGVHCVPCSPPSPPDSSIEAQAAQAHRAEEERGHYRGGREEGNPN